MSLIICIALYSDQGKQDAPYRFYMLCVCEHDNNTTKLKDNCYQDLFIALFSCFPSFILSRNFLWVVGYKNTTNNERVVFVDQNGKKVADSDKALSNRQNESFGSLRSFKNAENGTAGSAMLAT